MNEITLRLILNDIRGTGNVGSILRTADACGAELLYACGYTPYPLLESDDRPPHVAVSNTRAIAKTSLGAEHTVPLRHVADVTQAVQEAKQDGFTIIVLEQAESSLNLFEYRPKPGQKIALVLGNEVSGVEPDVLAAADVILEIPMVGTKESFGVAVAGGIALAQLRFSRS